MKLKPRNRGYRRAYLRDQDGRLVWRGPVRTTWIRARVDLDDAPKIAGKTGVYSIKENPEQFEDSYFKRSWF